MKSVEEIMNMLEAFDLTGSLRDAGELAGTPEWVVSRRLGHAHVQTTLDLYGWVREDEALRAAANWKSYAAAFGVQDSRHGAKVRAGSGAGFDLVAQDEVGAGVPGLGGGEVFTQFGDGGGGPPGW